MKANAEVKSFMTPTIEAEPIPLRADERGALRVGETRVTLDVLINEYEDGADPEGIVNSFPTLRLADVYAVIAYYLRHKDTVDDYLRKRQVEAAALRQEIESCQSSNAELRAKLLARRDRHKDGLAYQPGAQATG
jgi:uncharacterized protein (DUF433 family)